MWKLQELILLFGFLNGLWIYAGVNPDTEILKAFTDLVPEMSSVLFWIGVLILTVMPVWVTWIISKWLGLLAVLLAFVGGVFIESFGIWCLVVALIMGRFAPSSE